MKFALASLLGLAACSGSTATPSNPHPVDETPDAGPALARVDAEPPPPPAPSCVPSDSELVAVVDGQMILCGPAGCLALAEDGTLAETTAPAITAPPTLKVGDTSVDVCATAETCTTIKPKIEVAAAAIDATGAHVAILDFDEKGKTAQIEVRDVATGKQLGTAKIKGVKDPEGNDYVVRYVGGTVVVTDVPHSGGYEINTLWNLAGKKLKKVATLEGMLGKSTTLEPGRGALVLDDTIEVFDLAAGKRLATLDWTALGEKTGTIDPVVYVADAAGEVAVVVKRYEDTWGAGIFPATGGDARRFAIVACP